MLPRERYLNTLMFKPADRIPLWNGIPHVDHAIPPDVPLENYPYFREIMTAAAYGRQVKQV